MIWRGSQGLVCLTWGCELTEGAKPVSQAGEGETVNAKALAGPSLAY